MDTSPKKSIFFTPSLRAQNLIRKPQIVFDYLRSPSFHPKHPWNKLLMLNYYWWCWFHTTTEIMYISRITNLQHPKILYFSDVKHSAIGRTTYKTRWNIEKLRSKKAFSIFSGKLKGEFTIFDMVTFFSSFTVTARCEMQKRLKLVLRSSGTTWERQIGFSF